MITSLVSIHDVMPSTMEDVDELLTKCERWSVETVTLLVVPGLDWSPRQLDRLWSWQDRGVEFAGHGWSHACKSIRGLRHRLHSLLLSRNVAEHLELTSEGIACLLDRCAHWFQQCGREIPFLYVPPAWAMGGISADRRIASPFECFETLRGVEFPEKDRSISLPLAGFEADTALRRNALTLWNRRSIRQAHHKQLPLRISIHPRDHHLLLAGALDRLLASPMQSISYRSLR